MALALSSAVGGTALHAMLVAVPELAALRHPTRRRRLEAAPAMT